MLINLQDKDLQINELQQDVSAKDELINRLRKMIETSNGTEQLPHSQERKVCDITGFSDNTQQYMHIMCSYIM